MCLVFFTTSLMFFLASRKCWKNERENVLCNAFEFEKLCFEHSGIPSDFDVKKMRFATCRVREAWESKKQLNATCWNKKAALCSTICDIVKIFPCLERLRLCVLLPVVKFLLQKCEVVWCNFQIFFVCLLRVFLF